jgi:hypothetical protein
MKDKFKQDCQSATAKIAPAWLDVITKLQNKAGKANFTVSKDEFTLLTEIKSRFVAED